MSRRPARPAVAARAAAASAAGPAPLTRRGALLFGAGLVTVVLALFAANLTIRTLVLWWFRDDYVRTELVVTEVGDRQHDPILFATVAATGEEIHTRTLPTELYTYDSPRDATGTLASDERLRGMRIPIWWCDRHWRVMSDTRLAYVSEYGPGLPSTRLALVTTAVNAAIAGLGVLAIRRGLRSRRSA